MLQKKYLAVQCCLSLCLFSSTQAIFAQNESKKDLWAKIYGTSAKGTVNKSDTVYINAINNLAETYRYQNADSLLYYAKLAHKNAEAISYSFGIAKAYLNLGNYYSDHGDLKTSSVYYDRALALPTINDHKKLKIRILNNKAVSYSSTGDYAQALKGYMFALEEAEALSLLHEQSYLYENMANLYAAHDIHEEALRLYKKTMSINKALGNEKYIAETGINLANYYMTADLLEEAIFEINRSIAYLEKVDNKPYLMYSYAVKGLIYLKQKKPEWALRWFKQSELLLPTANSPYFSFNTFHGMAMAYLALNNHSMALSYAQTAVELNKALHNPVGDIMCSEILYKIYRKIGAADKALENYELYRTAQDSLLRQQSWVSLSLFESKMEYENDKKRIIEENKVALARERNYIYGAILVIILSLVLAYVYKRMASIQKDLNTELKERSLALELTGQKLKASNEFKNRLFSIIGHDLRGPLGGIVDLFAMRDKEEIDALDFEQFMPDIKLSLKNIYLTLNNLLSWGQSQSGEVRTKPVPVSVKDVADQVIELFQTWTQTKSIRILNLITEHAWALSDINQMEIVIRNLVNNAIKFTPKNGSITVGAYETDDCWVVSVRDTGMGMEDAIKERIFKTDDHVTTYGTENEKGTGLGLVVCKEMVNNNGGEIWVKSSLGRGTCFYFSLPKALAPQQAIG